MYRRPVLGSCTATLIAIALAAPIAATTIDFEDVGANLPIANPDTNAPEYFYNGYSAAAASQPTDFASGGATFNNDFTNFGGGCCWQGWSYSQTTDTTTPGFGNQYSAIPGTGAGGSATYGVAFTGGQVGAQGPVSRITFGSEVSLLGAAITNTTYAALSMQNGDTFSKKFGGASGSDPDYYILTITGRDASDAVTGSVDFALADYRFAEDALDYIIRSWVFVDLSGLGSVAALEFSLDSSDQGFGFLNTPSYFALDDLVIVPEPGTAALLALGLALLARRRS
jgi:uncharacterized protein DUF4465/PEP-CTERM motif-containing protein